MKILKKVANFDKVGKTCWEKRALQIQIEKAGLCNKMVSHNRLLVAVCPYNSCHTIIAWLDSNHALVGQIVGCPFHYSREIWSLNLKVWEPHIELFGLKSFHWNLFAGTYNSIFNWMPPSPKGSEFAHLNGWNWIEGNQFESLCWLWKEILASPTCFEPNFSQLSSDFKLAL